MNLTKNFSLDELIFSNTAAQSGIHNQPNEGQIEKLQALAENVLQPLRDYFGPVTILSGFRSANLNRAVGGAHNSQHLHGEAADLRVIGVGNDLVFQYICDNLRFDQVILEHVPANNPHRGWVHVSYAPAMRGSILSCIGQGEYVQGLQYAHH